MGYLHIDNLYKTQDILLFKRCYALEKIHGTSAHVGLKDGQLTFYSGGFSNDVFKSLFKDSLAVDLGAIAPEIVIFGEYYGGKIQGMKETYGVNYKFTAFDVKIGDSWLPVPAAYRLCCNLGIEFVDWVEISTDLSEIDAIRDAPSTQAVRAGITEYRKREGVVLRPLIEVKRNGGDRVIAKHKRDDFAERKTPQRVVDPSQGQVMTDAQAIADEWVVAMRLNHVLDKIQFVRIECMREVLDAMIEDVQREAGTEIVWTPEVSKAIRAKTAEMFKAHLNAQIKE